MDFLLSFDFSLRTLMVVMVVPFLYFFYHARFWYNYEALKQLDAFLAGLAVVLSLLIVVKMAKQGRAFDREMFQLGIIHLAPLILAILIVASGRGAAFLSIPKSSPKGAADDKKAYEDYKPIPLNKEIEKLGWNDLVIGDHLRDELKTVINLLGDPATTKKYGIEVPKGILLYGPPGTGKTMIAKVIANAAHLSFFALKMDEVVSKWVGESEKNLSKLFHAAQKYSPSVIFIDEVDSIGKSRSGSAGHQWAENLLNHLLQLVDGVVKTDGLYIIAATNRADLVDPALKRAGRLNKVITVPLPDYDARAKLFELYLSRLTLREPIDPYILANLTEGKSGADIKAICNQAGLNAFKRESSTKKRDYLVELDDIQRAMEEFVRS